MRGGASLGKPLGIPGGFGVAPVIGASGVATTVEYGLHISVSSLALLELLLSIEEGHPLCNVTFPL